MSKRRDYVLSSHVESHFEELSGTGEINTNPENAIFADSEVEYHFFWVHRRFPYQDLQNVRPVNNYNLTACFRFRDGSEFKFPLAYYDADYLLEILEERSPRVLAELAAFRDALTPPGLRTAQ